MTDRACVHCGEPIRYQLGSAKYRHVRDGKDGPTRCRDAETHAYPDEREEHVEDVIVALDGGQLHLDVEGGAA